MDALDEAEQLVEELRYRCYRTNRLREPAVEPHRWQPIFEDWPTYEERFQKEVAHA